MTNQWWPDGHDEYDWTEAWNGALWYVCGDGLPSLSVMEPMYTTEDIDSVVLHHVSYHGEVFDPTKDQSGTELELRALILFYDGAYGFLSAGNDYTGWGCQDYSEMRVGTWSDVVRYGMGNEDRELLGVKLP